MRHVGRTRFASRVLLLVIPLLSATCQNQSTGSNTVSPSDIADTYAYLAGRYELVGRMPDSAQPFYGTVRVVADGDALRIDRTIGQETISGKARIVVSKSDGAEVLRASFGVGGQEYEATYLWRSDLDNYPLLTGRVYRTGTHSPGVEAWFPLHDY